MAQNINFKGMLKKVLQEDTARYAKEKQNSQTSAKQNPFLFVTNHLGKTSQQYQKGQLKGLQSNIKPDSRQAQRIQIPNQRRKNRNSSYGDFQCEEQLESQIAPSRNLGPNQYQQQVSLISSNHPPSLFESKFHETKDQLLEQMCQFENRIDAKFERERNFIEQYIERYFKKYSDKIMEKVKQCRTQYTGGFSQITSQLNASLDSMKKKSKHALLISQENNEAIKTLSNKFNDYVIETDEKLERVINNQVSSSIQKSIGANQMNNSYAGDYGIELKNSIKDISCQNMSMQPNVSQYQIDQLRIQLQQVQESIKNIKLQVSETCNKVETLKEENHQNLLLKEKYEKKQMECSQSSCLKFQQQTEKLITKYQTSIEQRISKESTQYNQISEGLKLQESKINQINQENIKQVLPRLRTLEESQQTTSKTLLFQIKEVRGSIPSFSEIKKKIMGQIEPAKLIRTRKCEEEVKIKLDRSKQKKECLDRYMLDEENCLMDCYGNYLLDNSNKKIKLTEQQMYYLVSVEQMPITSIV